MELRKSDDIMQLSESEKHQYCQEGLQLKNKIELDFIKLGEYLYNIREHNMYEPYWSSFDEYTDEMNLAKATSNKLINIYKQFVLTNKVSSTKLAKIGWSKIAELMTVAKEENVDEWIDKAEILTQKDLRDEIREARTGIDMSRCRHQNTYTLRICADCGYKEKLR